MPVDDWFYDWYVAHEARHPRHDWPDIETEAGATFYDGLRRLFIAKGVHDLDVATEASERLMEHPPRFLDQHPPALHAAAVEIFKARIAANGGNGPASLDDRESAVAASKGCCYCDGLGMAVVWASKPDPEKKIGETASAYCICALGKWADANHREKSPDVHKRIPQLANVLAGRSFWRLNPPWMEASEASRVAPVPPPPDRQAVEASRGCPECKGTGWAKRRAQWHSMSRPFVVELACRCPLGSWRLAHDDGSHDSLQANPDVWDATRTHPTWGRRPTASPMVPDPATDGLWGYLAPDESAPAPMATVRDVAAQAAADLAPNPRRRWPDGLGKVEPVVPIPPKPPASVPMSEANRTGDAGEVAA